MTSALGRPLGARNRGADPIPRLYPEIHAGGFTRHDQRIIFFARVNALLRKDMTVLDSGLVGASGRKSRAGSNSI
jgi:hypothetical protein